MECRTGLSLGISGDLSVCARHDYGMDDKVGRALTGSLADVVTGADPAVATWVMARLSGLSGRGWLRLDESARLGSCWRDSPLDRVSDWRPFLAGGGPAAGVAASMCRDGRGREAAVAVLAWIPGPVAAAALAVRTADWVPQVSSAAVTAVSARPVPEDAAAVVPVMLALRERWRGRQAADRYLAHVAEGPAATLAALAGAGERSCRLWALGALTERGLHTADALAARAMRDRDPVIALWCARHLAAPSGDLPGGVGPRLLTSARAAVRAFAAEHVADDQLTREALRGLLLDRSGAVRSMARWRWARRWEGPSPVYLEVLAAGGPPHQIAAALQGLDEGSDGSLPAAAVPFLTHPSPKVRQAAVQAVGHHGRSGDIPGQLAPLLQDNSGKVVAAALRYLRGYALPPGVLAGLDALGTPRSRRTALSVRQRLGPWHRVHADLVAISGEDPRLAEVARTDLLAWLQHGAAITYGRPDAGQAAEIAGLLGTRKLTDKERRDVAFAAGIRTTAAAPKPG